ncbi:MAG: gamma-glutamyl-gamma-aminobutyrate hydrolase family protein [Anaerolineae bacterium]|nr:gamma-glutamyl-gamma-aminobutyrate hydrolase family protein [Anaerolineae bacterium]
MKPLIGITGRKDTSARLSHTSLHSVGETYTRAVHHMGGVPVVIPPLTTDADWPLLVARLDGLLLSGGEDIAPEFYKQGDEMHLGGIDLERDAAELGLVRLWLESKRPLLAICRGHQMLNVALGGTLYQDIATHIPHALDHSFTPARSMEQVVHSVTLEEGSRLAAILGVTTVAVNSAHHQSVRETGKSLSAVGYAPDGVIEVLELADHAFVIGVQWHPEAMVKTSETMWPLFEAFVQAARA